MSKRKLTDAEQADHKALLQALGEVPELRKRLKDREVELVERGRALGVPWAQMAEALGLASHTTLIMRMRAHERRTDATGLPRTDT